MGFDPFGLEVKKKRDLANLGFDREDGGDSSFMAMAWPFNFFFSLFGG